VRWCVHLYIALPIAICLVACVSLGIGARDDFARRFSCPEDRVHVVLRQDLRRRLETEDDRDLARTRYPLQDTPLPEVARDPERLAKWRRDQTEIWRERTSMLQGLHSNEDVFELNGCEHALLLACRHPSALRGGFIINAVTCHELVAEAEIQRAEQERRDTQKKSDDLAEQFERWRLRSLQAPR
jgi:hypothetical protein